MAEKVLALQGVPLPDGGALDLSLWAGETRRLTGSTTRLEAVAAVASGLKVPDGGKVLLLGRAFSSMRDEDRRVLRATSIGVAAPAWPLLGWLSVSENVQLGLASESDGDHLSAVEGALDAFDLTDVRGAVASSLDDTPLVGDGALLARALVKKPRLLIWQPSVEVPEKAVLSLLQRARSWAGSRLAVLMLLDDERLPAGGGDLVEGADDDLVFEAADRQDSSLIEVPVNLRSN